MAKKVNIGIIGLGTIGSAVVKKIERERKQVRKEGIDLCITYTADIDDKKRIKNYPFFKDTREKFYRKFNLRIVVELTGNNAYKRIKEALEKGYDIVTADKFVISQHGKELEEIASNSGRKLRFNGAVGGGIGLVNKIHSCKGTDLKSFYGILNGTTNYILTKMHQGRDFGSALKNAQEKHYAESNPEFDVSGKDAVYKLAILSSIAFSAFIKPEDITLVSGIEKITKKDVEYAKELGKVIKLLAICKKSHDKKLELRVEPCLIGEKSPLASIKNQDNALYVKGDANPVYTGEGAGEAPTAKIVFNDILDIASDKTNIKFFGNKNYSFMHADELEGEYFLRFTAVDMPGVLARISSTLAKNNIGIASAIQKERGEEVPVILTTHKKDCCYTKLVDSFKDFPRETATLNSIIRIENF